MSLNGIGTLVLPKKLAPFYAQHGDDEYSVLRPAWRSSQNCVCVCFGLCFTPSLANGVSPKWKFYLITLSHSLTGSFLTCRRRCLHVFLICGCVTNTFKRISLLYHYLFLCVSTMVVLICVCRIAFVLLVSSADGLKIKEIIANNVLGAHWLCHL